MSTYASSCCFFSAFCAACSFSKVSGFLSCTAVRYQQPEASIRGFGQHGHAESLQTAKMPCFVWHVVDDPDGKPCGSLPDNKKHLHR